MGSPIRRIDLYAYDLTYIGGTFTMSRGRTIGRLSSTVARVSTEDGLVGYGETCPLGSNYLPAHAAGARAALTELAPALLGRDAANPGLLGRVMDDTLLGHAYAKSALDIASWDVLGRAAGRPVCDLIGGVRQPRYPLYVAIGQDSPEAMSAQVRRLRAEGIDRFQLKLGGDPVADARRARAVCEAAGGEATVVGDANGGWSLAGAIAAAQALEGLPRFTLEQPCATLEECLRVRGHTSLPMILDEVIVDLQSLLRAWESHALEGVNLKLNRVGGLTNACLLRDVAQRLGLSVGIEDSWGGDLATAAVSHLAASTDPQALHMVSFMNDATHEHIAGYRPRSHDGFGQAPGGPGLGVEVDETALGAPLVSFGA